MSFGSSTIVRESNLATGLNAQVFVIPQDGRLTAVHGYIYPNFWRINGDLIQRVLTDRVEVFVDIYHNSASTPDIGLTRLAAATTDVSEGGLIGDFLYQRIFKGQSHVDIPVQAGDRMTVVARIHPTGSGDDIEVSGLIGGTLVFETDP